MENCKTPGDEDCNGSTLPCAPGEVAWSRRFPVSTFPAYSYVFALRVDSHDDVIAAFGLYSPGALDLGLEPVTSGPCGHTIVIAKLDGKSGATIWQAPVVGAQADYGVGLAVLADDSIALTVARGTGCTTLVEGAIAPGERSVLILGGDGHPKTYFPLPDQLDTYHLAARPGGLTLGGNHDGPIDFGGGVALPNGPSGGGGFVAALDMAGNATWATHIGLSVSAIDTDASGTTFAAWSESGSIFSGGTATVRVGSISAAGAPGWARAFTANNIQNFFDFTAISVRSGTLAVGGALYADADFGFGPVTANGYNSFLLLFDTAGNTKFGKWLDPQGDYPYLALDPLGGLYLAGGFNGVGNTFWRLATAPQVTSVWSKSSGAGPVAADSLGDGIHAKTEVALDLAYVVEKHAK